MLFSAQGRKLNKMYKEPRRITRRGWIHVCGLLFLGCLIFVELFPFSASQAYAQEQMLQQAHTVQSANYACNFDQFSPDGNPFALCPGPYPIGGNCVWWAWEQWHLLGYNLPLNWGNAAEWADDAIRSGFSVGTTPQVGSIAVFPIDDGYWATSPAGHVAFVTAVSSDDSTFNVTYQNYGDPTFMGNSVLFISLAR